MNEKPQTCIIAGSRWAPAALQGLQYILKPEVRGINRNSEEAVPPP